MFKFITWLAGPISSKLFSAIRMVETGGESDPENAVGDGGKAIGPYQIHEVYWEDAKSFDSSLVANGKTYQNCKGPGSFNYSERVMQVHGSTIAIIIPLRANSLETAKS
jgi:hypothetical protein